MEKFFNLIIFPEEAIYNISREEQGYRGFWFLALANISLICGLSFFFGVSPQMLMVSLTWGLVLRLLFMTICIFFITALYHYFAGVFGGAGSGSGLFKILPYSFAPYCFVAPVTLILRAFAGKAALALLVSVFFIIFIWVAFLQYKIISYFYGLSINNALAVLMAPWIMAAGFTVLIPLVVMFEILRFLL